MNEHPANAVRAKRDSSLVSSCALVAGGSARAVVSAGNSGAMLAAALFTIKRIPGIAGLPSARRFPAIGGRRSCSTSAPTPTASRSGSRSSR